MVLILSLACSCGGTVADDSLPVEIDSPEDSPTETEDSTDTGPFPTAVLTATPPMGEPPLQVNFSAEGSTTPTGEIHYGWDFGNGLSAGGPEVHTEYLEGGTYTTTLTVNDGVHQVSATLPVYVRSEDCLKTAPVTAWGEVGAEQLNEISGVVQSRQEDRLLWVHNDSGDDPQFYAIRSDGRLLGTYTITGAPKGDWEDIAIGADGGTHWLYIGDVGDNPGTREFIRIYRVPEPTVDLEPEEPIVTEVQAETLILRYPEEAAYNSETLMVDPRTQDLVIVTKDYGGATKVFVKRAPHAPGDSVLEHVLDLNFGAPPLNGGATTGGDISLDGSLIIVRTYAQDAWLWPRGPDEGLGEAMAAVPCRVVLPVEPQPESVCFTTDGAGLVTISERVGQKVNYSALE